MKHIEVLVGIRFNFSAVELRTCPRQPILLETFRLKSFELFEDFVGFFTTIAAGFVTEGYGVEMDTNLFYILQNVMFHLIFIVLEANQGSQHLQVGSYFLFLLRSGRPA